MEGIWLWSPAESKWIKSPADCLTVRLTAAGQAYLGLCRLHWVIANPSALLGAIEITDDADGLSAIKVDLFSTARDSNIVNLTPAMKFVTGIYLKTFTNMTSVVFGYTPPF